VGRDGKTYDLGYKAHLAVDADSDMPVAAVVASANENEKKHVEELLEKASLMVDGFEVVVADSQYSSKRVRTNIMEHGAEPVVPYSLIRLVVSLCSGLTGSSGPADRLWSGGSMDWGGLRWRG